jgi:hypothetical protein
MFAFRLTSSGVGVGGAGHRLMGLGGAGSSSGGGVGQGGAGLLVRHQSASSKKAPNVVQTPGLCGFYWEALAL